MFVPQQSDKSKAPPTRSLKPGEDGLVSDAPRANPIWQSLAWSPAAIQTKLAISQPGDSYEQEADRVAERVMRMPAPSCCGQNSFTPAPRAAQRKCAACEDEEEIKLQRKGEIGRVNEGADAPRIVNDALSSPGRPLSPATRAFMEPRFGHDFSQVRVHAGNEAAKSARSVNALAYTVGRDIVFGDDRFEDETAAGRTLLAHELAHVVQQSEGLNESTVQRWTIDDCNTAQSEYITDAISRGFADLTTALRLVSVRPVTDSVKDALWLAFRDSSDRTAELVTNNIRHLKDHLTSSRYRCHAASSDPHCGVRNPANPEAQVNSAYVSPGGAQTPFVYICVPTFTDLDYLAQAQAVVHEAAHQYLGLEDTGYFSTGSCLETRRVGDNPEGKDSGTAGDDPVYRLNNADAYSCFVHFLVHTAQPARSSAAAGYRGENLRLESVSTTIYTQTTNPQDPLFSLRGAPSNSGFQFRWKLLAGGRELNLESTRGYNTGEFYEDGLETPVFVSSGVRRILGRDHIHSGVIQCEIQVFRSAGERYLAPIIRKTVEITIVEGEDPFDQPLF